jgi:hypothetical protein
LLSSHPSPNKGTRTKQSLGSHVFQTFKMHRQITASAPNKRLAPPAHPFLYPQCQTTTSNNKKSAGNRATLRDGVSRRQRGPGLYATGHVVSNPL